MTQFIDMTKKDIATPKKKTEFIKFFGPEFELCDDIAYRPDDFVTVKLLFRKSYGYLFDIMEAIDEFGSSFIYIGHWNDGG